MLTLKQINNDKEQVIAGLEKKHFQGAREAVEEVIRLDQMRKNIQQQKDTASAEMNRISKTIGQLIGQGKKEEAEQAKTQTSTLKENIKNYEQQMTEAENSQTSARWWTTLLW